MKIDIRIDCGKHVVWKTEFIKEDRELSKRCRVDIYGQQSAESQEPGLPETREWWDGVGEETDDETMETGDETRQEVETWQEVAT